MSSTDLPLEVSLSHLASMCIAVYERESDDVIKVGPDQYSYSTQEKVLYISIAGTFNEEQHIMNALPFVYGAGQRALTALGIETVNPTSTAAYLMGDRHGWIEPASAILSSLEDRIDVNSFQRVIVCGHSRGGLLSYYLALHMHQSRSAHIQQQVHVVGFGMPVPLSAVQASEREFVRERVLCIKNINDPISNLPCEHWEPRVIVVGEVLPKAQTIVPPPTTASASLWGFVSGLAEVAVTYATDSLTQLRENIENHHPIINYAKLITGRAPVLRLPDNVRSDESDGCLFLAISSSEK